uniref:Uncharacterized protein n=1 Tax=Marseillevirus LCMAC103 TaxID=2506604 RepID=A0A481YUG1_9VIRU|nr:MAG: hypothetical protein LCMAC103_02830 [Marseillevirus LCMAC103]
MFQSTVTNENVDKNAKEIFSCEAHTAAEARQGLQEILNWESTREGERKMIWATLFQEENDCQGEVAFAYSAPSKEGAIKGVFTLFHRDEFRREFQEGPPPGENLSAYMSAATNTFRDAEAFQTACLRGYVGTEIMCPGAYFWDVRQRTAQTLQVT